MNVPLKLRILELGKRQIQIAREIDIPEPRFSKIVQGWVNPSPEVKQRIAKALKCRVEDVFVRKPNE
jgi:DNA-binding XRE family transcriptional regulator